MSYVDTCSNESERSSIQWKIEFDRGRHWRARIGFVLISNCSLIEEDMRTMVPKGVGVHFTRAPMPNECTVKSLVSMEAELAEAASRLLPGFDVDVICYACTSGSVVIGEDRIIAQLKNGAPTPKATTLVTGVIAGLQALGARKIVMGTPYLDEINAIEETYLQEKGFELLDVQGLNLTYDTDMSRVTPRFLTEFACKIDQPGAEAIFISCGGLRSIEAIESIERATGKPVVVSNQAMLWHCLRLAGIEDRIHGYGQLPREH